MQAIKLLLATAIAACSIPAMAQWQWIDGHGQKVFSDRAPPADIPAKNILRQPGGASVAASQAQAQTQTSTAPAADAPAVKVADKPADKGVDKGLEEQKRKQEQKEAEAKQAEQAKRDAQRADNCNRAKQAKVTLDSGRMLANINAKGERGFMDEATRAAETKRANDVIASDCGPAPAAK